MDRLILDAATVAKLEGLTVVTEVYDEAGRLHGHFYPATDEDRRRNYVFTQEQLATAFGDATRTGRPLADILADLRKRMA